MSGRQQVEDALKYLHDAAAAGRTAGPDGLGKAAGVDHAQQAALVDRMVDANLITRTGEELTLTPDGRDYALQVVRAHRLYETYLARRTGFEAPSWHGRANAAEHSLSRSQVDRLAASLGYPAYDAHGDPIPTSSGVVPPERGRPLTGCAAGWAGRVVHVEDEPVRLYRQLAHAGFAPDVRIRVDHTDAEGMTVRLEGRSVPLTGEAAAQIAVTELPAGEQFDDTVIRLSDIELHEKAEVVGISPLIQGLARSRLLDLGVVPGTVMEIDLVGPAGDPVAYTIRGASIALRREQSDRILVRRKHGEAA